VLTAVGARDVQRAQTLGTTFGPAVGTPVSYYSSYEALVTDPAVEAEEGGIDAHPGVRKLPARFL